MRKIPDLVKRYREASRAWRVEAALSLLFFRFRAARECWGQAVAYRSFADQGECEGFLDLDATA